MQLSVVDRLVKYPHPPRQQQINYIVIHNDDSPDPHTTFRWLKKRRNSYHYYINRSGKVFKLLDPRYKASHAGLSHYGNKWKLNEYSIAICLENKPPMDYTSTQYRNLSRLIAVLYKRYPGTDTLPILGHEDIAWPRGRKNDPGDKFMWDTLYKFLHIDYGITNLRRKD